MHQHAPTGGRLVVQIVDLEIAKLDKRLRDKDMGLELTMAAKALLAKKGYDPVLGARPLRRAVQHEVEDALSERILHGELNAGDHVHVDFADGEFVVSVEAMPAPPREFTARRGDGTLTRIDGDGKVVSWSS